MAMVSPLPVRDGVGATRLHLPLTGVWATVSDYMVERFGHLDPEGLRARFDRGEIVTIDGSAVARDALLGSVEWVWYYREPPVETRIPFEVESRSLEDDLLVVAKPHFLPTTPGGRYLQNSALVRLRNQLDIPLLTPVHRLDRATAGLLMFSVREESRGPYQMLFQERHVQKTYEAVSAVPESFDLEMPLVYRNYIEKLRHTVCVQVRPELEPNSETLIDVISRGKSAGTDAGLDVVHTILKPHTGKMHQLRVHLAALGLGILNDGFYPTLIPERPDDYSRPMQLLARQLEFVDPLSGEPRVFRSSRTLQEAPAAGTPAQG